MRRPHSQRKTPILLWLAMSILLHYHLTDRAMTTEGTPRTRSKRALMAPVGHTVTQVPQATQASPGTR